ncbi:hypothetical protein [Prosthecobacter sp.]|jgi:hypothetical protein|uniref:hypothetical protein n=1 Tax=Prosthecobacter sp. TaxID=1965333 RepID=UPI003784EE77
MNSRFVPAIEKPCPASWDKMKGDEKKRYCEHCQLHVHNLSAMTPKEQHEVLSPGNTRKCISYVARIDARHVDAESWLKIQSTSLLPRWLATIIAALTSLCIPSCRTTGTPIPPPPSQDASSSTKNIQHEEKRMTGTPLATTQSGGRRLMGKIKIAKE